MSLAGIYVNPFAILGATNYYLDEGLLVKNHPHLERGYTLYKEPSSNIIIRRDSSTKMCTILGRITEQQATWLSYDYYSLGAPAVVDPADVQRIQILGILSAPFELPDSL